MIAPVVLADALCVMVAPVVVSEVSGVPPPTAPVIATMPPVPPFNVKFCAPLIVVEELAKLIIAPAGVLPPFVVSRVTPAVVKFTGPIIVTMPPLVVILLAILIAVVPVKPSLKYAPGVFE